MARLVGDNGHAVLRLLARSLKSASILTAWLVWVVVPDGIRLCNRVWGTPLRQRFQAAEPAAEDQCSPGDHADDAHCDEPSCRVQVAE